MTKIYIKTYGCALNQSDSELMSGLLKQAKFEITKNIEDAFIVIVNTCTVKGKTETKFFNYLEKIKQQHPNKKIIITGCIPQTDPEKLAGHPLIGTSQITNIVQLVEETIHDNPVVMLTKEKLPRLLFPKIRMNSVIEIIPICEGCLGSPCTYCKVKSARGSLRSYPKEEIIKQATNAIQEHIPEIWLTAQDTGCYGKDINSSLPELLTELIQIPGNYKIRLGMLNPNHAYEFLDKLIEIYKSDKIFKFLHIPVQSGNNEILKAMKRKYTVEQFKEIIEKFKKAIPEITIATDVICGFPGETEQQFYDSLELIKKIKPDILNISRFWPRPKTQASLMENQVHGNETKKRSTLMTDIFQNISRMQNEKWLGWQGEILIDEKGKDNTFIGRNFAYKPVVAEGNYKLGDRINIKVNKITSHDLRANI
ncbi:tRNA (N(6)-L-threonylcarbamoyladenosine(37)-C(2))-methylthiotransferase [Candidatus Woesearchaeota archaeon]|nr:tRNA (N(6)-L-threonylcarbamoyladenosine(37)-C(2))-methylthiotransferase [Candidatus Woesearchaeota archaeon]